MSYITGAVTDYQGGAGGLYPNVPASGVLAVQGTPGQITAVTTAGTAVIGLADAGAGAATYGGPVDLPVITVDAKGRTTAVTTVPPQITAQASGIAFTDTASNVDIVGGGSITVTAISLPTDKVRYTITDGGVPGGVTQVSELDGSVVCTPNPIVAAGSVKLSNTGVGAGFYGDATHVGRIQLDAQGRALTASNVAITFPTPTLAIQAKGAPLGNASTLDFKDGLAPTLVGPICEIRLLPLTYHACVSSNALSWALPGFCAITGQQATVTAMSPNRNVAGSPCYLTLQLSFKITVGVTGWAGWGIYVDLTQLQLEMLINFGTADFAITPARGSQGITPFAAYPAPVVVFGLTGAVLAMAGECDYEVDDLAKVIRFNSGVVSGARLLGNQGITNADGYSVSASLSMITTW